MKIPTTKLIYLKVDEYQKKIKHDAAVTMLSTDKQNDKYKSTKRKMKLKLSPCE